MWELLDFGHKPEFWNVYLVEAKVVSIVGDTW